MSRCASGSHGLLGMILLFVVVVVVRACVGELVHVLAGAEVGYRKEHHEKGQALGGGVDQPASGGGDNLLGCGLAHAQHDLDVHGENGGGGNVPEEIAEDGELLHGVVPGFQVPEVVIGPDKAVEYGIGNHEDRIGPVVFEHVRKGKDCRRRMCRVSTYREASDAAMRSQAVDMASPESLRNEVHVRAVMIHMMTVAMTSSEKNAICIFFSSDMVMAVV